MKDYEAMENAAKKSGKINDVVVSVNGENVSLLTTYGLWLKKCYPDINAPEIESCLEYPNGFDFVYNFTQAVDGKVHYKSRVITLEFACLRPKTQWQTIRDELDRALQGQWRSFFFTDFPNFIWSGLFETELIPKTSYAEVKLKAVCDPFPTTVQGLAILDLAVLNTDALGWGGFVANYKAAEQTLLNIKHYNDVYCIKNGIQISLLERFGLMLRSGSPQIGKNEPYTMPVCVRGSDKVLDLTRALDGFVHFKHRTVTMQFLCCRPKQEWYKLQLDLEELLHGQWVRFGFKQSAGYWQGYCTVSCQRKVNGMIVTITALCNPYQL